MTIIDTANIQYNVAHSSAPAPDDLTGSDDELIEEQIALFRAAEERGIDIVMAANEQAGQQVRWTRGD